MKTFPDKRESLYTLLTTVVPYLNTHKVRLLISAGNITALNDLYGDITTAGTYVYLYTQWANKTGSRTKDVIDDLGSVENQLKDLLTSIYEDIPASLWNNTDRNTLRRKKGLPKVSVHHTTPISAITYMRHKIMGQAKIRIACYAAEDASRASINRTEGANSIELAILVVDPASRIPANELSGVAKKTAPATVNECPYHEIHSKAIIIHQFPPEYRKCDVYIYARLYDTRHPELAGPWSEALIIPIP